MSSHYEKKEPLEDDIIKKLIDRCVNSSTGIGGVAYITRWDMLVDT